MSYLVVVYDVPSDRTIVFRKLLRRYLRHVQQSVFFGDVTEAQCRDVLAAIERELEPMDNILALEFESRSHVTQHEYGTASFGSRFH